MSNTQIPVLETERLILRAPRLGDARDIQRLAGAREIAATTLTLPHPYEDGMAEAFISTREEAFAKDKSASFAITRKSDGAVIGMIGLELQLNHLRAEMGYWVGLPYWRNGYCTEAAASVLRFGFEHYRLDRIYATHFGSNPASGRVMEKIGMKREGVMRQHILKWNRREDSVIWSVLRSDFPAFR